jgi:hypothetical protein
MEAGFLEPENTTSVVESRIAVYNTAAQFPLVAIPSNLTSLARRLFL